MTDVAPPDQQAAEQPAQQVPEQPKPILGTGQLYTDVLAVFVRRFPKIMLVSLPSAIGLGIALYGWYQAMEGPFEVLFRGSSILLGMMSAFGLFAVAFGVGLGLAAGPLAAAFHEYHVHGRVTVQACLARLKVKPLIAILCAALVTLGTLVPMWMLALADSARMGAFLGALSLAVGMYALGLWGMAVPMISTERIGLRALKRALGLGKGYRWQIAGTCFLLFFTAILIGGAVGAGAGFGFSLIADELFDIRVTGDLEDVLIFLNFCFSLTLMSSILALGLAAIRERMVEIKEPPDIADMVDVFD